MAEAVERQLPDVKLFNKWSFDDVEDLQISTPTFPIENEVLTCESVEQTTGNMYGGSTELNKPVVNGSLKKKKKKKKKSKVSCSKRKTSENEDDVSADETKEAWKSKKKSRLELRSADPGIIVRPNSAEEVSSVDDDTSKGMKKWLAEYWNNRPGLAILQQKIDEFIVTHETLEEQARKEREALAAEEGWTVVVRQKGVKKTTDPETGISVVSVAAAAVMDNVAKKKKEIPLDFYRFQKREAKRNEVVTLQSKFEQDKKRIQQLRAARKFRPY